LPVQIITSGAVFWNDLIESKMNYFIVVEFLISIFAVLVGILLLFYRRRTGFDQKSMIGYAICIVLSALFPIVISGLSNPQYIFILRILMILTIGFLPALVFNNVLGYKTRNQYFDYRNIYVLTLIPAIILVLMIIQTISLIITNGLQMEEFITIFPLDLLGKMILMYSMGILVSSSMLTYSKSKQKLREMKFWHFDMLNTAILISIFLGGVSITNLIPQVSEYTLMLGGFCIIGFTFHIKNHEKMQRNLITREELFGVYKDGIILIDKADNIQDLNPAAEQLIGIQTQLVKGSSVEKILTNWNSISSSEDNDEIEFRGSVYLNRQRHYINVRVHKLNDERGKVIILRDMTARKGTDEIRQRAREEMFNLLRSLFKSANTSQTSNDFFRDVLYQIAYTFHSESGAICLVNSLPNSKKYYFSLMAKHGELLAEKDTLSNLQKFLVESKWIRGNKEPLVITDAHKDPQYALFSQNIGNHSIAIIPLVYSNQLMGVLLLARSESSGFSNDEIVRLGVVTDELASFIYSDRKRKTDIALAERRRLSQDLHDSITQKLYGLVTLTEAVKLGLESGAPINKDRMVEKISENARQALREMRLFLFELEPVDIERDGLVSTIQQRLDSVEGRSGIQPRMIADDEILLSAEKETEIYYIVEEALNNILKHANAKSVQVKLKKRKESIYIEIADNGCGFDSENIKFGGKGLGNIKDRAKRIKAKLRIDSSLENGTKITLIVPQ
jgi:PAS domain S-box-containing protein